MAKKITGYIKLQIPAGQATPAPPVGPALGQHGVNIMEFCKTFNARTQKDQGLIIPVVITVFSDRTFTFVTKTPPAAVLLLRPRAWPRARVLPTRSRWERSPASRSKRSPRPRCPISMQHPSRPPFATVEGTARSMGMEIAE